MRNYQNILLAVDFSEHGSYVAQRAKHLADQFDAHLNIIHVLDNIPMPDTPYGTVIALDTDSFDELLEAEKNKLKQISAQFDIELARRWLVWGQPQQEIVQIAIREQVDLIVAGSHGRHGIAMLMGSSTAMSILDHARCDVLAIYLQDS